MLRTRNISLNGTPQELTLNDTVSTPNSMSIQNLSDTGYAYLGSASVSSSEFGHKLFPGQSFTVDLLAYDHLWATGDSGVSVAVFILERP